MLLNKIVKSYIFIGIVLYAAIFIYWNNSISYFNLLNVFTFFSYAFLLWRSMNMPDEYFTSKKIGTIVFIYSSFFVGMYLYMSDYYVGNTFLFSEVDARKYEKMVNGLLQLPLDEWIPFISRHGWGYDDFGAPVYMAAIYSIVPHKFFLNLSYILLNTLIAMMLYGIGRVFMRNRYAFMSAMSFSIASYMLFYMGSFLKEELFVFIVVASLYFLYKYWRSQNMIYLAGGVLVSISLGLFRVPVALFMLAAYASLLLMGSRDKIKLCFFIIVCCTALAFAYGAAQYSANLYIKGGDVFGTYYFLHYNTFQKIVLGLGALIGPFPQLLQIGDALSEKSFYGSGLLFKLLLFYPFWKGLAYCIKGKRIELYPIFTFTVLEMISLILVLDGLELRKAIPHVPFFILAAFWYLNEIDVMDYHEEKTTTRHLWVGYKMVVCMACAFIMSFIWNIYRVG